MPMPIAQRSMPFMLAHKAASAGFMNDILRARSIRGRHSFIRLLLRISISVMCIRSMPALALEPLPSAIAAKMPSSHHVVANKSADFDGNGLIDYVVVIAHKNEEKMAELGSAPSRPLMVFLQQQPSVFVLHAQNTAIVYRVNEASQCDPFLDTGDGLATRGAFFTVENGVACGGHWTDYITFKYAEKLGAFVFHKRISETWGMNDGTRGTDDALVLQRRTVERAKSGSPVSLGAYRPSR